MGNSALEKQNFAAADLLISGQQSGDRLVFDGSNWVRKEACLFAAYMTGDTVIAASGVEQDAEFDTETYDIGGNFNTGTYTFTAPVAGYYDLKTTLMWKFLATNCSEIQVAIVTTAQTFYDILLDMDHFVPNNPITRWSQSLNVLAYMAQGDTAKVRVIYIGTLDSGIGVAAIDDGTAQNSTWFQGYLIA